MDELERALRTILDDPAQLNELRFSITVPAAELIAALAAVLLARFVQAGVRVRRENDSFI